MRYYGAAYYPEIFPRAEWERDIAAMAEAGMNVIRLGESAWTFLETDEGVFSFAWLDDAIQLCQHYGIAVVLGTPTYMPPPWLVRKYPGILPTSEQGHILGLGGRHHYCLHSSDYIAATRRIVGAMAEHFGTHPNVIGWQVHNEFGQSACYCERCAQAWQRWLHERYTTINQLNQAWRNDCWGRLYVDFSQIPLPNQQTEPPEGSHILSLILAHHRFRSDAVRRYQRLHIDTLRDFIGERWITHNAVGLEKASAYDHFPFFHDLDLAAWDNYPALQGNWSTISLVHRLYRGFKGRPHWVMEQICAGVGDGQLVWGTDPDPNEVSLWTHHSYAHGADAVLFWLWRSLPGGNWPYWQGILSPGGRSGRRYQEVKQVGQQLAALRNQVPAIQNGSGENDEPANVALLLSYDNLWSAEREKGVPTFSAPRVFSELYASLAERGLPIDVCAPLADLAPYALVVVPYLTLLNSAIATHLTEYVRSGGVLLVLPRTGRHDWEGILLDPAPGLLAECCGLEIQDYHVLLDGRTNELAGMVEGKARWWCDVIEPSTATTLAVYTTGWYAGAAALTWNVYGKGGVLYLGTYLDEQGYRDLITLALQKAHLPTETLLPPGCEMVRRQGVLYVFNHSNQEQQLALPAGLIDLKSNVVCTEQTLLAPGAFLLFKEEP